MSMPKGYKSNYGYATISEIEGGLDYRSIAEKMSADGFKMNHATARNVFVRGMSKIAKEVCEVYGETACAKRKKSIAIDPTFQNTIAELIEVI